MTKSLILSLSKDGLRPYLSRLRDRSQASAIAIAAGEGIVIACGLLPTTSFAADHLFAAPSQNTSAPASGFATAGQMTLALALVLAAVFVAAWLMRRLRGLGQRNAQAIQIVADISLGGKERAVLLQVGATKLLVGVAPGHVNTLHVLGKDESVRTGEFVSNAGANELPATFKAILKRSLGVK